MTTETETGTTPQKPRAPKASDTKRLDRIEKRMDAILKGLESGAEQAKKDRKADAAEEKKRAAQFDKLIKKTSAKLDRALKRKPKSLSQELKDIQKTKNVKKRRAKSKELRDAASGGNFIEERILHPMEEAAGRALPTARKLAGNLALGYGIYRVGKAAKKALSGDVGGAAGEFDKLSG